MNLVFNELSIAENENNIDKGKSMFEEFLRTYSAAIKKEVGFEREIYTAEDFNSLKIAENYYTYMWRNDEKTDRDLVRRFKSMCDRQQISNFYDNESEMYCDDRQGKGILGAFLNDMALISIASKPLWTEYLLKCNLYDVEEDVKQVEINNISNEHQLIEHLQEFRLKRKSEVVECNTPEDLFPRATSQVAACRHLATAARVKYPAACCVTSLMPHQLAAGSLTRKFGQ